MRQYLSLLAVSLLVTAGATAKTVSVPGDFATVSAAVADVLGEATTPDIINITTAGPFTEAAGLALVANSAEDTDLTIRGVGVKPVILLGPTAGQPSATLDGRGVAISIADYNGAGDETDFAVSLNNLTLLPVAGTPPGRAIYSNDNATGLSPNARMTINISNVLITANDGSNGPISDGFTAVTPVSGNAFTDDGLFFAGLMTEVNLDHVVSTHGAFGGSPDGLVWVPDDNPTPLNIGPGCVFSFNDRIGIQIASDGSVVNVEGTPDEPVIIMGNGSPFGGGNQGNAGLSVFSDDNSQVSSQYSFENLWILNNTESGIVVAFVDDADSAPGATFNHCIIAGNGVAANGTGINIADDFNVPWTFDECTVIDNLGAIAIVDQPVQGATAALTFSNSVLGGTDDTPTGGANDEQIDLVATDAVLNISDSALITAGPFAVAGTGVLNTGVTATVNISNTIGDDPAFFQVANLQGRNFWAPTATAYLTANSSGTYLNGGFAVARNFVGALIDGTDVNLGSSISLQSVQTQFGDNSDADAITANGSELDALYVSNSSDQLLIGLSGNLENNGNAVNVVLDTDPLASPGNGVSVLPGTIDNTADVTRSFSGMNSDTLPFPADFAFAMENGGFGPLGNFITLTGPSTVSGVDLQRGGLAAASASGLVDYSLSSALNIQAGLNASNVAGVTGGDQANDPFTDDPSAVTTGYEIALPLADLGLAEGDLVQVFAYVVGSSGFLSNQFLPPLQPAQGNLGGGGTANDLSGLRVATYEIGPGITAVGGYELYN
jgi:hypothetical protein